MTKKLTLVIIAASIVGLVSVRSMAANGEHHLGKAKHHLEEALKEIENAYNGREGYHGDKVRAEQAVRDAIEETRKAMEWARQHPSEKVNR